MKKSIAWYDYHAEDITVQYERVSPDLIHAWFADLLPSGAAFALDVGAGTGRDASWLARKGYEVVAVEPSTAMRNIGQSLHSEPGIQWIDDALPDFRKAVRLGLNFDFILLSAVWMHVAEVDRSRAFRKLITLLKPGGFMALSLRISAMDDGREMHPVSAQEIERLARENGAFVERRTATADSAGRTEVSWINLVVRLPDDGTGALPLLRHIIINDNKSSTYKLGLLRALCRIADGAAGYAVTGNESFVSVPLGLVGLYWLRLFKPLLVAGLPQAPTNKGLEGLGFVKEGFRRLLIAGTDVSHLDMRIGMTFSGDRAKALHAAIRDACTTIQTMPATYMTYPNGGAILEVQRVSRLPVPNSITLDDTYLAGFGVVRIPQNLWSALQKFEVWIEPAVLAEWARLIKSYCAAQGRPVEDGVMASAMLWLEPGRDVKVAREQAVRLITTADLRCVWSGARLNEANLDIDHCLPWVAWPCGDLWNLMPASRTVNQHRKREKIPAASALSAARERIEEWWSDAYCKAPNLILNEQFKLQARASLPIVSHDRCDLDEIFMGLMIQRLRLKNDQQVAEWAG